MNVRVDYSTWSRADLELELKKRDAALEYEEYLKKQAEYDKQVKGENPLDKTLRELVLYQGPALYRQADALDKFYELDVRMLKFGGFDNSGRVAKQDLEISLRLNGNIKWFLEN